MRFSLFLIFKIIKVKVISQAKCKKVCHDAKFKVLNTGKQVAQNGLNFKRKLGMIQDKISE